VARSSFLDLGIRGRSWLAAIYLTGQAALVLTASARPERAFGFQMFNESSTMVISLSRRVRQADGGVATVPVSGVWQASDDDGVLREFRWGDRVKDPILASLDRQVHASYGVEAQLFRLQKALDDVASHVPRDRETRALVADVRVRQNGRREYTAHLESAWRRE